LKSYPASIPNAQGDTLEEARANLEEAIILVSEPNRACAEQVTSPVPRHRETNGFLARKIYRELKIPLPKAANNVRPRTVELYAEFQSRGAHRARQNDRRRLKRPRQAGRNRVHAADVEAD